VFVALIIKSLGSYVWSFTNKKNMYLNSAFETAAELHLHVLPQTTFEHTNTGKCVNVRILFEFERIC